MVAAVVKYFQEQQCNCRLWLPSWDRWMNLFDFVATTHFWQRYGDRDKERHAFRELSLLILLIIYHHFS